MSVIKVQNLKKCYGEVKAVDDISFETKKGELFGFLGINGAGKSTTINMLSTLLAPTYGNAQICGFELGKQNDEIRRRIGIVYQQNCLDNMLTVEENLLCRAFLYNDNTKQNKIRLEEVSKTLELGEIGKRRYSKLSGGQKRRCEIASALMHNPEILFLDEPTTGLDPATRKSVWEAVEALRKNYGMTVFLTTHYMEEAAKSGQIVIIDKGRIIAKGTPFELKNEFASDILKLYFDNQNLRKISDILDSNSINYKANDKSSNIDISLSNTLASLNIIENVKHIISGFEVVQGNMDDVFLNATGNKLLGE